MAATKIWETLVGRRGSNAEDLFGEQDQASHGPLARRYASLYLLVRWDCCLQCLRLLGKSVRFAEASARIPTTALCCAVVGQALKCRLLA